MQNNPSIKAKILLPNLVAITLLFVVTITSLANHHYSGLEQEILTRGEVIAKNIREIAEIRPEERDWKRLVQSVGALPDVKLAIVVGDTPPRVIASTSTDLFNLPLTKLEKKLQKLVYSAIEENKTTEQVNYNNKEALIVLPTALKPLEIGKTRLEHSAVVVGMDTTFKQHLTQQTLIINSVAVMLGLGFIGFLIHYLLKTQILDPIDTLRIAMNASDGRALTHCHLSNQYDEIGILAGSYNELLDKLDQEYQRSYQAQQQYLESQQRLELAIKAADMGMWDWNIQSGTTVVSDHWYKLLGYDKSFGASDMSAWEKLVHPEDVRQVTGLINAHLKGENSVYTAEYRIKDATGQWRWLMDRGQVVAWDQQGQPTRVIGTYLDISARRYSEERAKEISNRLDAIINTSHEGIILVNSENSIESINIAAQQLFGITEQGILYRDIRKLFVNMRAKFAESISVSNRDHYLESQEFIGKHLSGKQLVLEVSIIPFELKGRTYFNLTVHDISARKEAEQLLKDAHQQALKAAHLKSEFIANMSHELRTPMNGILGMLSLLNTSELNLEQKEYTEIALRSGSILLEMVNQLLDFSKIEAGKLELEQIDFDLHTLIEDSIEVVTEKAHDKGLEINALISPLVPTRVMGDPSRLRQILLNYLSNAVKFTENGEVILTATLTSANEDAIQLHVEVKDTGIGIDPKASHNLFKPFSQADGSTTRRFGGTGLGLAICKKTAEAMGGSVGFNSEPGHGSQFWVTVVLNKAKEKKTNNKQVDLTQLRNKTALVVMCNQTHGEILYKQLTRWQLLADIASHPQSVVQMIENQLSKSRAYDLIIIEHKASVLDAVKLGREIRTDMRNQQTKLIMITSFGQRGDGEGARIAGFQAYLVHPIRRKKLLDAICSVMSIEIGSNELITQHSLTESSAQQRHRILVVDDVESNQKVMTAALKRFGYRVDTAFNGHAALKALDHHRYDLIFMDCLMPEMDGFETTRTIRQRSPEQQSNIPIIAVTANVLPEDYQLCEASGMNDMLKKPINLKELESILRRWLIQTNSDTTPLELVGRSENLFEYHSQYHAHDKIAELYELMGKDGLIHLYQAFYKELDIKLNQLTIAILKNETSSIEALLHSLKGSAGNIGAIQLAKLSQSLYQRAINTNYVMLVKDLEGLKQCAENTQKELPQLLESFSTTDMIETNFALAQLRYRN